MLSTSQLRSAWAPACKPSSSRVTITLYGGGRITVDRRCEQAFKALNQCLITHGYRTRIVDTGAYNCRIITGGTGYSLHAYGIAADLNWQTNPYGKKLITDMPPAMRADIKALRTKNGKQVFGWGGDYRTNKDAMHWEIVCSPADLATGLANSSTPPPPVTVEDFFMALSDTEQKELLAKIRAIDLRVQELDQQLTDGADASKGGISRRILASLSRIEDKIKK